MLCPIVVTLSISPCLWIGVIILLHQFSGQYCDFHIWLKKVTRKGSIVGAPAMIISLLMESFLQVFLSFSSLILFNISSVVNGESRIGSCLLSGKILLLPSSLFLSLSLTLNKLEKCSTYFFGGIESTWFGLLFVFPLSFLTCSQNGITC